MSTSFRLRLSKKRFHTFYARLKRKLDQPGMDQAGQTRLRHYLVCLKRYSRQLALPGLGTMLLSLAGEPVLAQGPIGPEIQVNSFTAGNQFEQSIASDDLGNTVTVYASQSLDGSGYGVYLKRYDHLGNQVQGETRVNTFTTGDQRAPSLAMDVNGDFVVVWQSQNQVNGNSGFDIYAQRYDAMGMAQGVETRINTFTAGNQTTPSVAMDDAGNFVIVWTSRDQEGAGSGDGVYAQRYTANGATQGTEFRINQFTTGHQQLPDITLDADGDFVVVWQSENQESPTSGLGIYGRRYELSGTPQGNEFLINSVTTGSQSQPAIASEKNGDFVVVWQSLNEDGSGLGIFCRRYNAAGTALSAAFPVNTYTTSSQSAPEIAMDADGDFVVVWQSYGQDGNKTGIYGQRYARDGQIRNGEFMVNSFTTDDQASPAVAMDGDGDFFVSWYSYNQEGPASGYGVYSQRFCPGTGGEFRVNSFTSNAQFFASVGMAANGNFIIVWSSEGQDGSNSGIFGQRYDRSGLKQGGEFLINTYTTNFQREPAVAVDERGNFVVVWESVGQDGDDGGIFGQRYNLLGTPLGSEFQVNTFTTSSQSRPQIAMDANGDFVVVWQSHLQDGDFYGIFGQRYDANGFKQGNEFQINTYTTSAQSDPKIAMDDDGDFVVVWQSFGQDGSMSGIYGQRYNTVGNAQGQEFGINENTSLGQSKPSIAMDATGNFMIVWKDQDQDNSIYGRRYNMNGMEQGNVFQVNTDTNSSKDEPTISSDAYGNFVVAWESSNQDGSNAGVFAQLYATSGSPQGGEFRVNSYTTSFQSRTDVAMDQDGDFVIAWESFLQDGNNSGVYAQRYRGKIHPCRSTDLNLTGTVNGFAGDHTQGLLQSNQLLQSNAQVVYQSGLSIALEPSFQIDAGAVFEALIDDCGI